MGLCKMQNKHVTMTCVMRLMRSEVLPATCQMGKRTEAIDALASGSGCSSPWNAYAVLDVYKRLSAISVALQGACLWKDKRHMSNMRTPITHCLSMPWLREFLLVQL